MLFLFNNFFIKIKYAKLVDLSIIKVEHYKWQRDVIFNYSVIQKSLPEVIMQYKCRLKLTLSKAYVSDYA